MIVSNIRSRSLKTAPHLLNISSRHKVIEQEYTLISIAGCERCEKLKEMLPDIRVIQLQDRSIGLGDTIHRITDWFAIEQCSKCVRRHYLCNKIFPYFWRKHTEEQIFARKKMLESGTSTFPSFIHNVTNRIVEVKVLMPAFAEEYMI